MRATWFENKELITLYTDPEYFGADVPDSYARRPSKPVPVKSLFGYEPASKMDDIHHKDSMLKIALQMKSGTWDGPPIVVRKDPKGYQVLDGHHRMHAARKAGIDTLDAVVVDREDIEYSDEVKEQRVTEASGYIPTAAQANDPRFKTALTVDVRPGEDQRNISKLGLDLNKELVRKTSPGLKKKKKPSLAESLMEKYQAIKEEDLLEVDMGSGALRSWAKSPEAQAVNAGFELELILPDTETVSDDDNEADMDADEPIGTLDQIVDFYDGDDRAWEGAQRQEEEQFREAVIEDLMDYEAMLVADKLSDEEYELVRAKATGKDLFDSLSDAEKDDFLEDEVSNQGPIYQEVEEEVQEEIHGSVTWQQFWERENVEAMSDLMNRYDLYWPYTAGSYGGSKQMDEWAEEISAITGKGTNVSYQYHGEDKVEGKYTLEPDTSIDADSGDDAGIELVSPVMPLGEAVADLEKLMKWADDNDVYTNQTTGLHMNISVPQGNDIDYTKLVLFSGDKYILDKYDRLSNSYANSALGQLETRASQMDANTAASSMQKMKTSLQDAAEEFVRGSTGQAKYTSVHIKDGYIEFRGPGGVYTNKDVSEITDTMLRFARAMTIAADPQAFRQEYQKKLYKTLSKAGGDERTIASLFTDFQSGDINKEVFKKRWANLVVKQKQNQAILNKLDDKPDDKRLTKAKQIQKDLGGPVKPWKYKIDYTSVSRTGESQNKTLERKVKASTAQLATQAAVQDALEFFDHPQVKPTTTPDFNSLKVEIDLPDDAGLESFSYEVPYTKGDGGTYNYEGKIKAQNADAARDEIMKQAQVYFQMNSQFTPDYPSTTITSLDAAWMQ